MNDSLEDIRQAIRKLCEGFPGEYWRTLDQKSAYPTEFVEALTDAGFLAVLIPNKFGGSGLGVQEAGAILEEIHAAGCNGGACHAQMYTMGTVLRHGSEQQKEMYLPKIASGELRLQAFGVTEPTSGTDTSRIRTTASLDGDSYIINGQKVWTSRIEHSDLFLLLARTQSREAGLKPHDGMSVFLIDIRGLHNKGLEIKPLRSMINHSSCEVFFDNLRIPTSCLIGDEGRGFRYILDGMNAERILIAFEAIGDARWFIQKATEYSKERIVFDRHIGQNQGIQFPIAESYAEMSAARLMVQEAARLFDSSLTCAKEANIAKFLSSEASWKAGDACMQTFGGFGFAEEYDVERKFRETRLFRTAPISSNLILSYIAEHVLGLPRSF